MNSHLLFTIFSIIFLFIIIIVIIKILSKNNFNVSEENIKSYDVILTEGQYSKNMNYCLPGCIRGTCNQSNDEKNSCKYDFQCSYCQDENTNMFYVNNNPARNIQPIYEEEHNLNYNEIEILNNSIDKNNEYIDQLNEKIEIINS